MSTSIKKGNRINRINTINKLAAGFKEHGAALGDLVIDTGDKVTSTQVVGAFDAIVQADTTVATARGDLQAALLAEKKTLEDAKAIVKAVRRYVRLVFGAKPDVLAAFGLAPARTRKLTTDEKSTAVAKQRATRKARGTRSKKELAKIHGDPVAPATPPTATHPVNDGPSGPNGAPPHGGA
jgi:hypothetical protein